MVTNNVDQVTILFQNCALPITRRHPSDPVAVQVVPLSVLVHMPFTALENFVRSGTRLSGKQTLLKIYLR